MLIIHFNAYSQSSIDNHINELKQKYPVVKLTKEEMYQDFDSLYNIISYCNPQLRVRKQVTGFDILKRIESLRNSIDTIKDSEGFVLLLHKVLRLTLDDHCQIGTLVWFYNNTEAYKVLTKSYTDENYGVTFNCASMLSKLIQRPFKLEYIDGEYYICDTLIITTSNSPTVKVIKAKLLEINGLKIDSFIYRNIDIQYDIRWDDKRKKFYSKYLSMCSSETISSIRVESDRSLTYTNIIKIEQIYRTNSENQFENKCVEYIDTLNTMYIKCPIMNSSDINFYRKEIRKYRKSPIQKIIIDVRGNNGGDDRVWMEILSSIIEDKISVSTTYLTTTCIRLQPFLNAKQLDYNKNVINPSWDSSYTYNLAYNEEKSLIPRKKSLNNKKSIYILKDEDSYSSSLCLVSFANSTNSLVSVGTTSGKIGGQGIEAMPFVLPNSKIIIQMDVVIDGSNVRECIDLFHDEVEIEVIPSIDYYIPDHGPILNSCSGIILSDPFIQAVFNQKFSE